MQCSKYKSVVRLTELTQGAMEMFYERSSSKYFRLQGPMFSFLAMLKSTIIQCIDNT